MTFYSDFVQTVVGIRTEKTGFRLWTFKKYFTKLILFHYRKIFQLLKSLKFFIKACWTNGILKDQLVSTLKKPIQIWLCSY